MLFNQLGLSAELLRAIDEKGYQEVTPIQQKSIPLILDGKDILAGAQTGTGKTAGFALPLLQRLQFSPHNRRSVRALILTPTRELAAQVGESVRDYGRHLPFRTAVIFGGVSINTQFSKLRKGADVVVATPGRLLDHLQRKTIDLSKIEVLVLDEGDRMLDMGFIRDIKKIFKFLPNKRQNLLFSATFSNDIRRLAADLLNKPIEISVAARNQPADRVKQIVYPVDKSRKRELLSHRIGTQNWQQVLVFARTKRGANRLAENLSRDGLNAEAIHGNKSQAARTRALRDFKAGRVRVLVATDIAARGLDIDRLPHVVNYELPFVPEDYVHRIGRTARAGQEGEAISLVCAEEHNLLRDIEQLLKRKIDKEIIPGYEPDSRIKAEPVRRGGSQRPGGRGGARPGKNARAKAAKKRGGQRKRPSGRQRRAG
jgi:ATP-dependent RNA helicase RhlE